jgi:5-methylcytosine-specific restriction endonuclease McrA
MRSLAHRKVLVLNKNMVAVGVVSLQRAIVMLFSYDPKSKEPKAHIIDDEYAPWTWEEWAMLSPEEGEDAINACSGKFKIPEVIKLNRYDKLPQHKIHFSRRTIYKRDGNQCMYCGRRPGTEELTIDHIIPRSEGGLTTWENCVLACVECNSKKANVMPDRTMVIERVKDRESGREKDVYAQAFTVFFQGGGKKTIKMPKKPHFDVYRGEIPYKSWSQWLSVCYWRIELENDNKN